MFMCRHPGYVILILGKLLADSWNHLYYKLLHSQASWISTIGSSNTEELVCVYTAVTKLGAGFQNYRVLHKTKFSLH